ncbi:hypothetical protein MPTK1_6g15080 [Marchantia polymorpha subsp. ruderalis]|uniref:AAA+ ATPase domain-containing protein n=2 Tax=Marchantia polymorpha TaxID=3197 RepID=A0A176WL01_MARPO|nr:hypothetical protein AXG93_3559s1040 [Marchantia polymorpha subsp. ruderalis]PTQ37539.1 hypothetical protein MARPO_0056s0018 [Marchantia polymorpha]BBN14858.1 hypothetical protein Mp_6g15080 [Marchantia polymorpha subsp. ruderalis]|eukprot:PTQ37539.1 hypothetical protein MARPO_0056s0018 [Marchantia polymorpha]
MAGGISLTHASSLAISGACSAGLLVPLGPRGVNVVVSRRIRELLISRAGRRSSFESAKWRTDLQWLRSGIAPRRRNCSSGDKIGAGVVNCATESEGVEEEEDEKERERERMCGGAGQVVDVESSVNFAGLVLAVTALGFAIPAFTASANAAAAGGATKKKSKAAKAPKAVPTMSLEERKEWTKDLPLVREQIPYSELLRLKEEGKVKHIVKHPLTNLKSIPDRVLVIMSDDRVVRTVLPASERDVKFWNMWDELKLADDVIDAYSPPLPGPVVEDWALKGPSLRGFSGVATWIRNLSVEKKRTKAPITKKSAARARLEQLERERKQVLEARREKERLAKDEAKRRARERKYASSKFAGMQESERKERMALDEQAELELKLAQQVQSREEWSNFWYNASRNEGFRFLMGIFFFWLFYLTIVVGVKKRKQDYEDRLKIEQSEEEERKKMREWEQEMETFEAVSTTKDWGKEGMSDEEKKRIEEVENNPQLKLGLRFMRSGATARRAKGRKPPQYLDLDADIKFADVAGLGDIRKELEEIVDFFTFGEKYRRRGSRIPAGILLCGEPGTGKTLLAKAVAGEAGVNFFSISASQFVEIYVGVGASRVRALYNEARDNAPAVVFIDELDAVGRQRGLIGGSGGQERDSTLNQLLTCLDGFEGRGEVITIAATNRPDILDSALVRPGRFDRKIFIPKPGTKGRAEILKVHARNKPMAEEVDYGAVAEMTDGMVGAQLANILDVAALSVLRDSRNEITTDDLLEAAQLEEGGHPDPRPRSTKLLKMLALNEASMATCAVNFPEFKQIQLLTIVPRMGEEKGAVRFRPDHTKFDLQSIGRQGMLDYITVQLSPRAADELWNGADNMSTIWADTVDQARSAARDFVYAGLSDRKDLYGLFDCWNEIDQVYAVDVEALKIVNSCYKRALEILEQNKDLVNALVDRLVEDRTIRQADFQDMVEKYGNLVEEIPQPIDVRNEKLAAFREEMFVGKRSSRN